MNVLPCEEQDYLSTATHYYHAHFQSHQLSYKQNFCSYIYLTSVNDYTPIKCNLLIPSYNTVAY